MKKLIIIIILFSTQYCFTQTLNYSVNSGSESKNIDTLKIDYVIGEAIAMSSNLINVSVATLSDSVNGIYQIGNEQLKLFPNPANNWFSIELPITAHYEIDLLDNSGKHIINLHTGNINCYEVQSFLLNKLNIANGSYLLHIKSKEINGVLNFVIQK